MDLFFIPVTNLLKYIQNVAGVSKSRRLLGGKDMYGSRRPSGPRARRKSSVRGIIKRTCSIQVDQQEGKYMYLDCILHTCQLIYHEYCLKLYTFWWYLKQNYVTV